DRSVDRQTGTWLRHMDGWGLPGDTDIVALRAELLRESLTAPHPRWLPKGISPPAGTPKPHLYWQPWKRRDGKPLIQRSIMLSKARAEERRTSFLNYVSAGMTIAEACEAVGVERSTYQRWRTDHEDFRLKVDRIRIDPKERTDVDADFISRRRYYFGYETYTHHKRIIDAIEDTPPGGITMLILPPEAGKTTLLTDWVCDKVAQEPNTRILYVSETVDRQSPAAKVLGNIKDRMTDVNYEDPDTNHPAHIPEWHAAYGPFRDDSLDRDKPWNAKFCKVHQASGRKDYTFQVAAWRSKIYGARTDWLILDDIQSAEGIGDTDRILDRLRKTFFNRPGANGHIVIIGTRVGVGDVYERLAEEIPDEMIRIVQIPALDEHGNSYCPEMWPIRALENKRAIVGEDGWLTAYMMQPQAAGANTFTEDLLNEARDPTLTYGIRSPLPASLILAGLDPALGGGNAMVCGQTTAERFNILAAQVDYGLARNEDIFTVVRSMCRYHFTELVVERNSQQRGIARDDRLREIAKIFGFRIVEHETGQNKWDFAFGVGAMAGSFIKGEIRFPDATTECRRRMEALRTELLAWRPNVDPKLLRQDLVMALWFTWMIWMQRRKRQRNKGEDERWRIGGVPWSPGDMSGMWARSRRAAHSRHPVGVR
ncbi:MAG: hypothetical protein ACODAG_12800, partial [Myxococcota bacterium]